MQNATPMAKPAEPTEEELLSLLGGAEEELPMVEEQEDGSALIIDPPTEEAPVEDFYANLAETLPSEQLNDISNSLETAIELDIQSREKRDKYYSEGLRKTGLSEELVSNAAFDGSSTVVHPILAEVSVDFSARAIKELFPAAGPVKINTESTDMQSMDRAELKRKYLNWQLTEQIVEFRDNFEQCLTQLPPGGSQYIKFGVDTGLRKRPVAEFVPIDDLILPYSATSIYTAERITHRQRVTRKEFNERVDSGLYRKVEVSEASFLESSPAKEVTDSIQGLEEPFYNEDGLRELYEVSMTLDLGDGLKPYIVTQDKLGAQILSIYRNWDPTDESFQALDWIVEFKFIPWRGPYGIGIYHLAGGLATAATGALRALLDSAHVNNLPSLLRLKGTKTTGQTLSMDIGKVTDIESNAVTDDVRKLIMAVPFNQPSPVLYNLLEWCSNAARGVVATAEESIGQAGDRTPVGTTMAMVEQGSYTYSAIHARLHHSFAQLLRILCRINRTFLPEYKQNPLYPVTPDLFAENSDIAPVSDPNIFSEAQRMAQMQSVMQLAADQRVPYDLLELHRRTLKLLRVKDIDKVLPPSPQPMTADVASENAGVLSQGLPLKAHPDQNHMAHIQGHIMAIQVPWVLNNPMVPPQLISGVIAHINEHMQLLMAEAIKQLSINMAMQQGLMEEQIPDDIQVSAQQEAYAQLGPQLVPLFQALMQLDEQVKARTPPPPMPPEIQAQLQMAQMENQRKTQLDQAKLSAEQQQEMARQQVEQARMAMEQAKLAFDQRLEASAQQFEQSINSLKLQSEDKAREMAQQVELIKNQMDNHQKQTTELLKNRDDNATNLKIAMEKLQTSMQESLVKVSQDTKLKAEEQQFSHQLEKLQLMLSQMGQEKSENALSQVLATLSGSIEALSKPRQVVRGPDGKVTGVQTVKE